MYIVGIDRANLSRNDFVYKVAISNIRGQILQALPIVSRDMLKKIINHPMLTDPCVWSIREFKMIENLTCRSVLILKEYHKERNGITNVEDKKITPFFLFNRIARQLKHSPNPSLEDKQRYNVPTVTIYKDKNGHIDPFLTSLCYETAMLGRLQIYDDLFE